MRQTTVITSVLGNAQQVLDHGQDYAVNMALGAILNVLALNFQHRRALKQLLHTKDGPLSFKVVWQSDNGNIAQTLVVQHGTVKVVPGIDHTADAFWIFRDRSALRAVLTRPPNEVLLMLLRSEMTIDGNLSVSSLLNFLLATLLAPVHGLNRNKVTGRLTETVSVAQHRTRTGTLKAAGQSGDPRNKDKVTWLSDPFLSEYQLLEFRAKSGRLAFLTNG